MKNIKKIDVRGIIVHGYRGIIVHGYRGIIVHG